MAREEENCSVDSRKTSSCSHRRSDMVPSDQRKAPLGHMWVESSADGTCFAVPFHVRSGSAWGSTCPFHALVRVATVQVCCQKMRFE